MAVSSSPEPAGQGYLALEDVSKSYGSIKAVDGVSFNMQRGEFLTILGPSGCGKTTLLRAIAGFTDIGSGRIVVNGEDVTRKKAGQRNIGMVFQSYALFPHMSVFRNIAYPLRMRGVRRGEIERQVNEVLRLVDLQSLSSRLPAELSGGQQQRVALARAIVFKPHLLLLDEPFSALDRQLRNRLQEEIRTLQRELKLTTIFITHDQEEALVMSDRVAVMRGGMIEQIETPKHLYDNPGSAFVARFVGEINQLGIDDGQQIIRDMSQRGTDVPGKGGQPIFEFENTYFFRPDSVSIHLESDGAPHGARGTISNVSYLGGAVRYSVTLSSGAGILVKEPVAANVQVLSTGDPVRVRFAS